MKTMNDSNMPVYPGREGSQDEPLQSNTKIYFGFQDITHSIVPHWTIREGDTSNPKWRNIINKNIEVRHNYFNIFYISVLLIDMYRIAVDQAERNRVKQDNVIQLL